MLNMYRLEQRIHQAIAAHSTVGVALAIVQGTEITYARGFGRTSVEDGGVPVTPDTLFCCGSISKTLTATLVLRLVELGMLDLDVPVVTYLPGFSFSDAALGARITLRHVLSHTTGLPSGGKDFGPRDADALRRFVWDELAHYRFVAAPGTIHLYSNTVIVLAGYLAELVTGTAYEQLMAELVFAPLQMERSTFDRTVAMTYPLALAHARGADGVLHTKHRFTDNVSGNPAGFGICSTLDLAKFAVMQVNNGRCAGTTFLSPSSVHQMHTPVASRYVAGAESGYGLGLYTGAYKGVRQVLHGGLLESYTCFLTLFPDRQLGVVLQCNYDADDGMADLVEQVYDAVLNLPSGRVHPGTGADDRAAWPRHVGTYLNVHMGLAHVRVEANQLVLERNGEAAPLLALKGGLYDASGAFVGFVHGAAGPTQYLVVDGEPYGRFEADPTYVPNPGAWEAYAGTYVDWTIDPYPLHVRIVDRELRVRWPDDEVVCTPLSDTSFVGAEGLIEFEVAAGRAPVLVAGKGARKYRLDQAS